ncbi:hypothetical protein KIL84_002822, partial [Mauremys mutica]
CAGSKRSRHRTEKYASPALCPSPQLNYFRGQQERPVASSPAAVVLQTIPGTVQPRKATLILKTEGNSSNATRNPCLYRTLFSRER